MFRVSLLVFINVFLFTYPTWFLRYGTEAFNLGADGGADGRELLREALGVPPRRRVGEREPPDLAPLRRAPDAPKSGFHATYGRRKRVQPAGAHASKR